MSLHWPAKPAILSAKDARPSDFGTLPPSVAETVSLERCREILGLPLSDAEIAEIRDTLLAFAYTLVDGFIRDHASNPAEKIEFSAHESQKGKCKEPDAPAH
jgi:hypothetical protein